MRRPLVAGNWKMHGSRAQAAELLDGMPASIGDSKAEVVVCPSFVYLDVALSLLKGSSIAVGGQDCNPNLDGAFTGEVSAQMLSDLGCTFVILGHSERRTLYGETDQLIAGKYAAALQAGLRPILCVGETLEQRDSGQALAVVKRQLTAVFADNDLEAATVVAYEPIWAIGTGKTATPEQAQEVHAFIRAELAQMDSDAAAQVRILYGGSLKAANANEIFMQVDIDGGLIGGAALKQEEFAAIVMAAT
ncbi:MAG: triosephosphate isomerase [Halieaceae bacterium]